LSNLRFPFLFTEFDADTELTTIRIIEQLSRYENVNDLKEDTVTSILFNQALRQKIQSNDDRIIDPVLVKDAIIEEVKIHKILVEDKIKQVEQLDEKVKEKEILVSNLTNEKSEKETQNSELLEKINNLEKEKRLETKYYEDKESWQFKKEHSVLKKWDELPKRKWYLFQFIFVSLIIVGIMCFIYHTYHTEDIIKLLMPLSSLIGGTIILSFYNREKITTSYKYNFRTETFRKEKMSEFETEFIKQTPEPKRNDYTAYK
jgi:hypothetical protein